MCGGLFLQEPPIRPENAIWHVPKVNGTVELVEVASSVGVCQITFSWRSKHRMAALVPVAQLALNLTQPWETASEDEH
jgi:hypothetical protein